MYKNVKEKLFKICFILQIYTIDLYETAEDYITLRDTVLHGIKSQDARSINSPF